jgi:protein-disulfide isomerase
VNAQVRKQQGGNGRFLAILGLIVVAGGAFIAYRMANKPASAPPTMPAVGDTLLAKNAKGYTIGRPEAPIEVVEFADFECNVCGTFSALAEPDIRKNYVETGKIRFTFYDFPIVNAHPNTMPAHQAAACADEQGKFWPMHDRLMEQQAAWNGFATSSPRPILAGYAKEVGLDETKWNACMDAGTHDDRIKANYALGLTQQVRGTPTFIIDGVVHQGGNSYDQLAQAIDAALAAREAAARPIPAAPAN